MLVSLPGARSCHAIGVSMSNALWRTSLKPRQRGHYNGPNAGVPNAKGSRALSELFSIQQEDAT
jgi:hypothetical protein